MLVQIRHWKMEIIYASRYTSYFNVKELVCITFKRLSKHFMTKLLRIYMTIKDIIQQSCLLKKNLQIIFQAHDIHVHNLEPGHKDINIG